MPRIACRIVEICVFRRVGGKSQYLILKRSKKDKIYPGIWQIVTGFMDAGEKAVDAALREVKEETGITPGRFWIVPHVNSFYVADKDTLHHTIFFAAEFPKTSRISLSREHETYRWIGFQPAHAMLVWPGQKKGLRIVRDYIVGRKKAGKLTELRILKTRKDKP
ncbi:MAG: hydrolase, NUDIX family protein [Bacteroidetes bacterium]|nr:hydrolase, NUDIX family protein [Bacteroidota bacterium]